jgi:hypothetical protein
MTQEPIDPDAIDPAYDALPDDDDVDDERREMRWTDRAVWIGQLFTILCVVGVAVWAHFISENISHVQRQQAGQAAKQARTARQQSADRNNLIDGCNRLAAVQKSDNTSQQGVFILFESVIGLSRLPPAAPQTPAQTRAGKGFLAKLKLASGAQSWTPIPKCTKLIDSQGSGYKLPEAVAFLTASPPKSALLLPKKRKKK